MSFQVVVGRHHKLAIMEYDALENAVAVYVDGKRYNFHGGIDYTPVSTPHATLDEARAALEGYLDSLIGGS